MRKKRTYIMVLFGFMIFIGTKKNVFAMEINGFVEKLNSMEIYMDEVPRSVEKQSVRMNTGVMTWDNLYLRYTLDDNNEFILEWDAVEGAVAYEFYVYITDEHGNILLSTEELELLYPADLDTFLSFKFGYSGYDKKYTFKVRAFDGENFGSWGEVSFIVPSIENFTPKIISTESTYESITMNWVGSDKAGAYEIYPEEGVTVYYRGNPYTNRIYIENDSITFTGLKADREYKFALCALYTTGYSEEREVTVRTQKLPEIPGLNYEITNYNDVHISWKEIPGTEGYDDYYSGYEIIVNDEKFFQHVYENKCLERQFDFGTENIFQIRFYDGYSYSPWRDMQIIVPYPSISEAYNINSKATHYSITLDWEVDGIVEYTTIECNGKIYTTKDKIITINGLRADTEYVLTIYSTNNYAESEKTEIIVRTAEGPDLSGMYDEIHFTVEADKEYSLSLSAENILTFVELDMVLIYNPEELELTDFAAQTGKKSIKPGKISGTDIEIILAEPGKVIFSVNKSIPEEKVWTGILTILEFKAKATGETTIIFQ